jgi:hypothetical protein
VVVLLKMHKILPTELLLAEGVLEMVAVMVQQIKLDLLLEQQIEEQVVAEVKMELQEQAVLEGVS